MRNESIRYLIVPGWQGSPDNHWQSHWQRTLPNSARVEQQDWLTPQRQDWVHVLEQAIAAERSPVILIAHSLGCITVAHWAAQASPALLRQVRGALLVAPADVERPTCAPVLRNFAPIPTDLMRKAIRQATVQRKVVPVLCGSALDCIGVQPVLDGGGGQDQEEDDEMQNMSWHGATLHRRT